MESFPWNIRKAAVKLTIHQNSANLKNVIRKNSKIADHKNRFWILKIFVFLAGIGYSGKLLSNHWAASSPENLEDISNLVRLRPEPSCSYKKSVFSLFKLVITVSNGTIQNQSFQNRWFIKFCNIHTKTFRNIFFNPLSIVGVFIRPRIMHRSDQRHRYMSAELAIR